MVDGENADRAQSPEGTLTPGIGQIVFTFPVSNSMAMNYRLANVNADQVLKAAAYLTVYAQASIQLDIERQANQQPLLVPIPNGHAKMPPPHGMGPRLAR